MAKLPNAKSPVLGGKQISGAVPDMRTANDRWAAGKITTSAHNAALAKAKAAARKGRGR